MTAEGIEVAGLDGGGDWLVEQGLGRVRIQATSRTDAVFVGIAPESELDSYLSGTAHDELRDARDGGNRYRSRDGGAAPAAPAAAGIWVAAAVGEGTQTVEWNAREGQWAVAVMNADGSRPVAADVSVGAKLGILPWLAGGLLLAGLLSLALGAGLIGVAARGRTEVQAAVAGDEAEEIAPGSYPVAVDGRLDAGLSRWLWLLKWLLAVPHLLVLALLWIAFPILTVVALTAVVATVKWWLPALPHYIVIGMLAGSFTAGWPGDVQIPGLNIVLVGFAAVALLSPAATRARSSGWWSASTAGVPRDRIHGAHAGRVPAVPPRPVSTIGRRVAGW